MKETSVEQMAEVIEESEKPEETPVIELSQIRGAGRAASRRRKKQRAKMDAVARRNKSNKGRISELERQQLQLLWHLKDQFDGVNRLWSIVEQRILRLEAASELMARALCEGIETLTDEERAALAEFGDGGPAEEATDAGTVEPSAGEAGDGAGPSSDVQSGE